MLDFLSFLPCCGPRKRDEKDNTTTDESATLIPPRRPDSILSADGSTNQPLDYGAVDQQPQGLTGEQRRRIEAIGREVGNQMLPIHTLQNRSKSPSRRTPTPSRANATHLAHHGSASTSPTSSRPSSPSPMRPGTSPPNNTLSPPGHDGRTGTDGMEDEGGDDGVVRKQLFAGGLTAGGDRSRRGSARGGRGRGRGKPRGK